MGILIVVGVVGGLAIVGILIWAAYGERSHNDGDDALDYTQPEGIVLAPSERLIWSGRIPPADIWVTTRRLLWESEHYADEGIIRTMPLAHVSLVDMRRTVARGQRAWGWFLVVLGLAGGVYTARYAHILNNPTPPPALWIMVVGFLLLLGIALVVWSGRRHLVLTASSGDTGLSLPSGWRRAKALTALASLVSNVIAGAGEESEERSG